MFLEKHKKGHSFLKRSVVYLAAFDNLTSSELKHTFSKAKLFNIQAIVKLKIP